MQAALVSVSPSLCAPSYSPRRPLTSAKNLLKASPYFFLHCVALWHKNCHFPCHPKSESSTNVRREDPYPPVALVLLHPCSLVPRPSCTTNSISTPMTTLISQSQSLALTLWPGGPLIRLMASVRNHSRNKGGHGAPCPGAKRRSLLGWLTFLIATQSASNGRFFDGHQQQCCSRTRCRSVRTTALISNFARHTLTSRFSSFSSMWRFVVLQGFCLST